MILEHICIYKIYDEQIDIVFAVILVVFECMVNQFILTEPILLNDEVDEHQFEFLGLI